MSATSHERVIRELRRKASVFAALGDETRLTLLTELSKGRCFSITHLTQSSKLTRQAISKHLRVLQRAGLVRGVRSGREKLFEIRSQSLDEARSALERISRQWDVALDRLRAHVEK
jgi:DNA-binding transcriptional ArsR family regulator